jgi:hypothetical protein
LGILFIIGRLRIGVGSSCGRLNVTRARCSVATIASTVAIALASVTVATIATLAAVAAVTIARSATSIAVSVAAVAVRHWAILVCFVVVLYLREKPFAEILRFVYALLSWSPEFVSIRSTIPLINIRNVEVHWLLALLAGLRLHKTGTATLDLDFAAGFLLDVLDVVATTTNYLCTQVEAADGLKTYRELLFGPFTLSVVSEEFCRLAGKRTRPYSSRSKFSGSRRRKRRSSTRLGSSWFSISSIILTAVSSPSFDVLVTRR